MSENCTTLPGSATGIEPILFTLVPGRPKSFTWNFTGCTSGVQNFVVYVTQPRAKNGMQKALPPSTELAVKLVNLKTGEVGAPFGDFVTRLGSASYAQVEVTLLLSPQANKNLDVEVTYTAAFYGD